MIARGVDVRDGNLLAVNKDLPLLRVINAAEHLDQRGFAGAVFAQQRVDLACLELKIHMLQRLDARK